MKKQSYVLMAVAIFLVIFISPFASKAPDGLERVARDYNFASKAKTMTTTSPFQGYALTDVNNKYLSKAIAGGIGAIVVFGLCMVIGKGVKK